MKIHKLKTWSRYLTPILDGRKTFELRYDDRAFAVGDVLHLREWYAGPEEYGVCEALVQVTYILPVDTFVDYASDAEFSWVVLGFKLLTTDFLADGLTATLRAEAEGA